MACSGYSSLNCLHRIPLDAVKIDRSVTGMLDTNRDYAAVIDGIVTLAHGLNMQVTVEGIETRDQLAQIKGLGCDLAQGRKSKMEVLYCYLAGPSSAIFESFSALRDDLEQEKRAMQRIWAKREKQIDRVLTNTVGTLPKIEGIELKTLAVEVTNAADDAGAEGASSALTRDP
ncbi:MAG: EAL domain-containing protein [Phycisphaerae bacterium]|nr:EAL domain-containing protein [Phycisphaerae bacterium]